VAQFQYRLQTLLDQKLQAKEEAQQTLANVQRDLRKEEQELESCRREQEARVERLERARAERLSPAIGGSNGEMMQLRRDYIARLKDECDDASDATRAQELRVSETEERLAAARETLASASRDLEVLQKHRARLERRFNEEAGRKEALDLEEMANVIFLQGRKST
jgi:flagellar biosynthesis chaperone FliJ